MAEMAALLVLRKKWEASARRDARRLTSTAAPGGRPIELIGEANPLAPRTGKRALR